MCKTCWTLAENLPAPAASETPPDRTGPALRLSLVYAAGATAWILLSDAALGAVAPDVHLFSYLGMTKGIVFVAVSTLLLWGVLRRHEASLEQQISASARAEASTRAMEERLRLATRAANVGLWDWDLDTNRVFYSAEWKRQIGYEVDEISDQLAEWQTRVHPDDVDAALEMARRHIAAGATELFENLYRFQHRDGRYRWILAQASVYYDDRGRAVRMMGSHIDITDRKRAEETLRGQEVALEIAHEAANLGVWHHDLRSDLWVLDARAQNHFGTLRSTSTLADILARVHADDRARVTEELTAVRGAWEGDRLATEHRVVRPGGEVRWLSLHMRVVSEADAAGRRPVRVFGTSQDVTERKRSEQALRESEERLRQAQKMESIGQLAGGVAHDFNNMLVIIQGHVELIEMAAGLPPDLRESCQEIARAAERAAGLTRQLLVFSRRQVMQFRDLDLNVVVGETSSMLRRVLGEDIDLQVRRAPGVLAVHADRGMIDMVLLNLAVNARDAMPDGGTLNIETSQERQGDRTFAVIEVRDTGCGIAPDILPRIFEPFFTTKEVGKGTGLGLATVFGAVREHEGTVEVESQPGAGTTFRVRLPMAPAPRQEPAAGPPAGELRGGTETVLLVEDEPSVRSLVSDLLARLGYHVLEAANGVEALETMRSYAGEIALVMTDLVMPGRISGLELGRQLAAIRPGTRIVYTSGFSTELHATHAQLVDGVNFLAKPFSARQLAAVVRQQLDEPQPPPASL